MKTTLMEKVRNSIFEVMETMFFLAVEDKEMGPSPSDKFDLQTLRSCRITFSGDPAGTIYFTVPQNVLETMTVNFMGEDNKDLTQEHTDGTLKEALNMIAGSALTQLNKEDYMGLGIPEMIDSNSFFSVPDGAIFDTGEGYIAVLIELNG